MVFCNRRERLGSTLSEEIKKKRKLIAMSWVWVSGWKFTKRKHQE